MTATRPLKRLGTRPPIAGRMPGDPPGRGVHGFRPERYRLVVDTQTAIRIVLDAGFDRAACLPLDAAGDPNVAAWLAEGHHGSMRWLERHAPAKAEPAAAFPDFRSVIVAALEYGAQAPAPRDPAVANISRYALGDDYHDVLKARLHRAADALRAAFPGTATRAFVDTGPLNEKLVAARAGLGWVGKHTNLIDPRHGSYLFLGLLLTSARLAPLRGPEPDRCGLCEACLPACPTGAIVAPYVLDARRCISYLTIELRGPIPRPLRPLIGNRVFGCDDCQEVCPWNRFARAAAPAPLGPRERLRSLPIAEILALDVEDWRRLFRGSAVKRPGHAGLLRNALVAAGNARDPALLGPVARHLASSDALLRGHAAWALGRLGGPVAAALLEARLVEEADPAVREELLQALVEPGVAGSTARGTGAKEKCREP